eukprot:CAMPEP_0175710784 /NCGR_PEP_ID=MMETSP0097-20121207/40259_1 /TAXON_ID=311494 /ORGANISM="Alexandrium monilatum, Strain CCMP3105" /LENGTH=147 /DNA_ID=CAMNT_0017018211 /DNA_START=58 /DNA_END=501 /DNA_ORIENTATION=+
MRHLALPLRLAVMLGAAGLLPCRARKCHGGSYASCQCLLQCEVFGGVPWQCNADEDNMAVVDAAVQQALEKEEHQCDAMWCIIRCAKHLDCLSSTVKRRCLNLKVESGSCDVDCDGAWRTSGVPLASLTLVVALLVLTAIAGPPASV